MTRFQLIALLVAACSTPRETVAPAPIPAPAPAPAAEPAADPWQAKPADPAADAALLKADVDILCGAAKVTGGTTVVDVGPYIAEHMKTAAKVELFANIRDVTLDEFVARIRTIMAAANVTQCATLDVLIANDPRKPH
ncbi:MAG: hypothetical protein ABI867_16210 [Kofleriaceae bacterium]